MNVDELITELSSRRIKLSTEGNKINYRAPKGAVTENILNLIKIHKSQLIRLLSEQKDLDLHQKPVIQQVDRSVFNRASFSQERMKFIDELQELANISLNIPWNLHFSGQLDPDILRQALREIVKRHEILRTTFCNKEGIIQQLVSDEIKLEIPILDSKKQDIKQYINEYATHRFCLESGPLIRAGIVELNSNEYILLLTLHHIIADGWSIRLLIEELTSLYEAYQQGQTSPLPPLSIQYIDFTHWQRQYIKSAALKKQKTYWKEQLKELPTLLELPYDQPRPKVQRFVGEIYRFHIPLSVQNQVNLFSQSENVTTFMTLLSAYFVLLSRYSGQTDICVGTPVANRQMPELHELIGLFVNSVPLRVKINPRSTVHMLLQQVKTASATAFSNQDTPLEHLVEVLNPERSTSYSPLFQYMFSLQNVAQEQFEFAGIKAQLMESPAVTAKFDMSLMLTETPEGIYGALEYCTDLFEKTSIEAFCHRYINVLTGLINTPSLAIKQLPLVSEYEYTQSLSQWNQTINGYPRDSTIHTLFESQVTRNPNAIAIQFKGHTLSYEELNHQSNQLAHCLVAKQIKPEDRVGICISRSLSVVTAMLGILKAGGCYVPLAADEPQHRIDYIINSSDLKVIVTQSDLLHIKKNHPRLIEIVIDTDKNSIRKNPVSNPELKSHALSPAYIIYTSGSTGKPKGVTIPHRAVNSLICDCSFADIDANKNILQLSTTRFDASTFEIWGPLLHGGRCVIYPQPELSLECLRETVVNSDIDIVFLTTALFNLVVDEQPSTLNCVSQILTGGESISLEHVNRAYKQAPNTQLIHVYGPTESTTFSTFYPISKVHHRSAPAIGLPVNNKSVYVLDDELNPVPTAITGELYIGGDALSQGYVSQPSLTAQCFLPNPFSNEPGARLYKTGDKVKQRNDGNIIFVERMDQQIKIRGFRIEPAEIENTAVELPGIIDAAVVPHRTDTLQLAIYVVAGTGSNWDKFSLHRQLQSKLPSYMLPTMYLFLDRLPITPNGKLDHSALPTPCAQHRIIRPHSAARSELESTLISIWSECLDIPVKPIGIHDNFFDLGGHSLLATRVIARIKNKLNIKVTLKQFFEFPTVLELSQALNTEVLKNEVENRTTLCSLTPCSKNGQQPLSFAQQRIWFVNQYDDQYDTGYNMSQAFKITGDLNIPALSLAVQTIVDRHDVFRSCFQTINGQTVQVITPSTQRCIPLTDVDSSEVPHYINQHACHHFDLSKGPLLDIRVLRVNTQRHFFLVNMHHIISDGWSLAIFNKELSTLYNTYIQNGPNPLPPLSIQYIDFSYWQRQWLTKDVVREQLEYWRMQLADLPASLKLPADRPQPELSSPEGKQINFTLGTDLSGRIRSFCQRENVTLFMFTLAVFHILLSRYSENEDIFVGTTIANRQHPELEPLIGFFINILIIRSQVNPKLRFIDYLGKVKTTTLEAFDNQDIPFESVVEHLQPERSNTHHPMSNVSFAVQNAPIENLQLEALSTEQLATGLNTSKFDLFLQIFEADINCTAQGSLYGSLEYNTKLFKHSTAQQLLNQFQQLLNNVIATPDAPLRSISLLSDKETQQLLTRCGKSTEYRPTGKCIHELFEAQAERSPFATALLFKDNKVTYSELNIHANRIAHYLAAQSIGPGSLVGILMERSIEVIVAIVAVLKAGAAYVPLAPDLPKKRLDYLCQDTKLDTLLIQPHLINKLPNRRIHAVVVSSDISDNDRAYSHQAAHNLCVDNSTPTLAPENLACVMYTSGSTGQPKGIMVRHKGVVRLVHNNKYLHIDENTITLQHSPLSFDASTFEIWAPLVNGGNLVIAHEASWHFAHLNDLIEKCNVNTLWLTAGAFDTWIENQISTLASVNYLIVGGDIVTPSSVNSLYETNKRVRIINAYGPTENTTFSCCYEIPRNDLNTASIPIGKPINHTFAYVLDQCLQPMPPGFPGELYLGGDGVAKGYLNQPELTNTLFINNPFSDNKSDKLFRTGDTVRWLSDGNLEFLGRKDRQVKINGYRIECGEIEHVLQKHELVSRAVVSTNKTNTGYKQLVAYIGCQIQPYDAADYHTAHFKDSVTPALRQWLKGRLPEYMQPSHYQHVDTWPLTKNGKMDYKALSTLLDTASHSPRHKQAPTEVQSLMAAIWQEILDLDGIGIDKDFFEIGGHSLLATRIVNRINRTFDTLLQVKDIFVNRTIRGLSACVEQKRAEKLDLDRIQKNKISTETTGRDEFTV